MRAKYVKMEWENSAHTIVSFYFSPAEVGTTYRYVAGQYALITVPHADPDSRGDSRTMTLSSSPSDELLKFTLRYSGHDGSSFKQALMALQPGSTVTIYDAMGDLVLPLDPSIPLVFVAGGIGIASYVGIVEWLMETNDKRGITLLYAVAQPEDVVFQKQFDNYANRYDMIRILYMPSTDDSPLSSHGTIEHSRLSAADILRHTQPNSLLYLSGPEAMVENLRSQLATLGVSHQQIIFDYFEGYTSL